MIVVWNAEFAQSYIAHARRSRRPSPSRVRSALTLEVEGWRLAVGGSKWRSVSPASDPFAEERVDDDVAAALTSQHVVSHERRERGLYAGRPAQAVPRADVGAEQLLALFEHHRPKRAALRHREPLPHRLEDRMVLVQQPPQRRVQVFQANPPRALRPRIVPRFVRQPLDIVGQVAGQLDDRAPQTGVGFEPGLLKLLVDERRKLIRRNSLEAQHRTRLVERPAAAQHALQDRKSTRLNSSHSSISYA